MVASILLSTAGQAARPNILIAIADDQSYPHSSAYGDPVIKTPAFDQVAKRDAVQEGMKLLTDKRARTRDVLDAKSRDILFGKTQLERR